MDKTLDLVYDDIQVTLERATLADARVRRDIVQTMQTNLHEGRPEMVIEEIVFTFFITQIVRCSLPLQKITVNPGWDELSRIYQQWLAYFDDEVLVTELWNVINGPLRAIPGQKKASETSSANT